VGWLTQRGPACPYTVSSCRLLLAYLTGYRLLACALTAICGVAIALLVCTRQPRLGPAALAAWLWNPLTLFSTALGGHNDVLWIVLFLASLWLLQHERPFWAFSTLILAAHVKLTALLWAPVYVLWVVRKWGWRRALACGGGALALGLAASWLLYLPFGGWGTLPRMLYERALYVANSPSEVAFNFLKDEPGWRGWVGLQLTTSLPNWLFVGGGALLLAWSFSLLPKRWWRPPGRLEMDDSHLWSSIMRLGLLYLAIGAFWFQPWYFLWVLAPAALLPHRATTRTVIPWLSFGAVAAIPSGSFLLALASPTAQPFVSAAILAIIWGPGLLAAGFSSLGGSLQLRSRVETVR
jgi:hypothetical protein